jgi:deoxyribonuclease V
VRRRRLCSDRRARAACVLIDAWNSDQVLESFVQDSLIEAPYRPGEFYRRELPCLVSVLRLLPALPDAIVIDGYVWLPPDGRPGLGAHLDDALEHRTVIVGIAKTAFASVASCPAVAPVLRGASRNPLYVSSAGLATDAAAVAVRSMAGPYRIPDIVRITDRLSRTKRAA